MSSSVATYPLDGPFYCPQCGYDQRGQPVDGACPECGQTGGSVQAAVINRWADYAILDLWAAAVLLAVGVVFVFAGWALVVAGHSAGGLLVGASWVYMTAGAVWYAVIVVRYLRRRRKPNIKNLMPWRRRELRRWLIIDLVLVLVPPGIWLVRRLFQ